MASGTKSRSKGGGRSARQSVAASKPKPWGTIAAVIAVLALAGGVFTYAYVQISEQKKFTVSEDNQDPSVNIDGVVRLEYAAGQHVKAEQRVAYDQSPPFGGPHDQVWADCSGIVYTTAVRNENMVHALEHGSIWVAYNPDQVTGGALDTLKSKVEGQPDMLMSPYPGLDRPISLQSWGHQLKLDSADDERIDQFIKSLKRNQYQNPEPRGRCDSAGTGFVVESPPPFVAEQPDPKAPNTVTMDGKGAVDESGMEQNGQVPAPTAPGSVPASGQQPPPSQ